MDVLLSSGFLAFARHIGFLDALTTMNVTVDALVGTSSGALVGALFAAGHSLDDIHAELGATPPLKMLSWSPMVWRGMFTTRRVQDRLREFLPERIEDLPVPFAVGLEDDRGGHTLARRGPLVEAVMASCAMPVLFHAIEIEGRRYADGGAVDRLGVDAWRQWRPDRRGVAHWVDRTAGKDIETDLLGLTIVRTPRSGAKLWSLGDFAGQREEARRIASEQLATVSGT